VQFVKIKHTVITGLLKCKIGSARILYGLVAPITRLKEGIVTRPGASEINYGTG